MIPIYSGLLLIYALTAIVYGLSLFDRLLGILPVFVCVILAISNVLPSFNLIAFSKQNQSYHLAKYIGLASFSLACLALSFWLFSISANLLVLKSSVLRLIEAVSTENKYARDFLYPIRSSWVNGSFELAYMLFLGCCAAPDIMPSRYQRQILTVSVLGVALFGSLESIVMARYYSLAVFVALFSFVMHQYCIPAPKKIRRPIKTAFICLILSAFLFAPSALRFFISGHAPIPWGDASTMSNGVAMRDGTIPVQGINLPRNMTVNTFAQRLDRSAMSILDPVDGIRDFVCSALAGPLVENYTCSGYLHRWAQDAYIEFYGGKTFPVLPTSLIASFAGTAGLVIVLLNYTILSVYPVLALASFISSEMASSLLCLSPLWAMKLISFWRGDPLHSGISFAWILVATLVTACLIGKASNGSASNQDKNHSL